MQSNRETRENSNPRDSPFDSFGGFGFRDSMLPSIFGGRDPFDDPFFSRPYGSLFGSDTFRSSHSNLQQTNKLKAPVIKEIDSDAEEELGEQEEDDAGGAAWSNRNPLVEHPEDQTNDHEKSTSSEREISHITSHNKAQVSRPQTHGVSFQRVTYGGIDGAYYSATTSRRSGSDGVTIEECKQADRTTGQATHRVSRGIHDKGHSVTRKLESDGKVDTVQTLHNLDEGELAGFERAWGDGHFQPFDFPANFGSSDGLLGQLAALSSHRNRSPGFGQNLGQSGGGRPKKVVRINIE
ncbi:hypothetical protein ACS0TY_019668 [Phlomoides rotata]